MTLHPRADLRFKPPLEREVQKQIIGLFRHAGVHVGSTSQYRASHVEEGIPDLLCHAEAIGKFFWFEVKTYRPTWVGPNGPVRFNPYDRLTWQPRELSPKQVEFRARAQRCGVLHAWGGLPEAEEVLVALGLGVYGAGGIFSLLLRRSA